MTYKNQAISQAPLAGKIISAIAAISFATIPIVEFLNWIKTGDIGGFHNGIDLNFSKILSNFVIIIASILAILRVPLTLRMTLGESIAAGVLVVCAALGATLGAVAPMESVLRSLDRTLIIVSGIALCWILSNATVREARWMVFAVAIQPILHAPIFAWNYLEFIDVPEFNWRMAPLGYFHFRYWSAVCAVSLMAVAGFVAAQPRNKSQLIAAFLGMTYLWTCVLWTGSRSELAGIVVATLISILIVPKFSHRAVGLLLISGAAGVLIAFNLEVPTTGHGMFFVRDVDTASDISAGRLEIWAAMVREIPNSPLFGHGFGQLHYVEGMRHGYPHNVVLQVLFAFGIPGGLAAIYILLSLWIRGTVSALRNNETWRYGIVCAMPVIAVGSLFNGSFYSLEGTTQAMLLLAVLTARPYQTGNA